MMLEHIGERPAAQRIESALHRLYRQGTFLPHDVGGTATTAEFTKALTRAIEEHETVRRV